MSSSTARPAVISTGPVGPDTVTFCFATQSPSEFLLNASQVGSCSAFAGEAKPATTHRPKRTRFARNSKDGSPFHHEADPLSGGPGASIAVVAS